MNIEIPQDAFSDGQIRSKLWLANSLNLWSQKYINLASNFTLNWYGSWVGLGPFILLSTSLIKFNIINLIELDKTSLDSSLKILNHWTNKQNLFLNFYHSDMSHFNPKPADQNQIFINTSCEHVLDDEWLNRIPKGCFILLQSTNMLHAEHINLSFDLVHFQNRILPYLTILEKEQIDFTYTEKSFSRFMIFGQKCS